MKPKRRLAQIQYCPACVKRMSPLGHRGAENLGWERYVDPVDGVTMYRCKVHGRFYVAPGGAPVKRDPMTVRA